MSRIRPLCALAALGMALVATGEPEPRIDRLSAIWFQRGTTRDITVHGANLTDGMHALVTGEGVHAEIQPPAPPAVTVVVAEGLAAAEPAGGTARSLRITLAPDASLGEHQLRLAGPHGITAPLALQVTDLPERDEPAGTDTEDTAPEIPFPSGIAGRIATPSQIDHYRLPTRPGVPFVVDLRAARIGSPLDATLILRDPSGRQVARSDDGHGLDPFLSFVPDQPGAYRLDVHDQRFQGSDRHHYHLVAGHLPRLESVFPLGGRRGTTVDLSVEGVLLEGVSRLGLQVADNAPDGPRDVRVRTPHGISNPVSFFVDTLPSVAETESGGEAAEPQRIQPPAAIDGRIGTEGDLDTFVFRTETAGPWVVDVLARRAGSPLDALLTLADSGGKVLQQVDDAGNQPDPRLEFQAEAGAEYRLVLRDLVGRGGARFGYRIRVHPADRTPDFAVRVDGGRVRIARGGRTAVRCRVERRHGFDGLVRISPENLPRGVSAAPLTLAPGHDDDWLVLEAEAGADAGNHPLRLIAVGEHAGTGIRHPAGFAEDAWLTVLPPAPFRIDVREVSVQAEQNQSAVLHVTVMREPGFTAEVTVRAEGPGGVSIPEVKLDAATARADLGIQVAYNAAPGIHPLILRGEAQHRGSVHSEHAARAVPIHIQPIPVFITAMLPGSPFFRTDPVRLSAAALPEGSDSAANSTEFVVKVDRRGFAGAIQLRLDALPDGVSAVIPEIPPGANEATVRLRVGPGTAAVSDHAIAVTGTAAVGDRTWNQRTQPVSLTILAPPSEPASGASTP